MSLAWPSLRMSTGVPSNDCPLTSGITWPTAGSGPFSGSFGSGVPMTVTGRVCSTPAATLGLLLPEPPPKATAAARRTTTTAATPIHSHGGPFLRAAATAPDFCLVSTMDFAPRLVGRMQPVAGPGHGQQRDDEGEPRQRHGRDREVAEALHPDERAGV